MDLVKAICPNLKKEVKTSTNSECWFKYIGGCLCIPTENILKSMNFKMPVETVKKKFFPDEETLQACVEAGKEYAKLVK